MSTYDQKKPSGRLDQSTLRETEVHVTRTYDGGYRCACGREFSREIAVIACDARGHRATINEGVRVN